MSERSIEVPDPDPPRSDEPPRSPYGNLLVPLVVVPFLVVVVLVLVFVFFGQIAGKDASIEDNLERVVHGGSNESKQAAMSLSSQAVANAQARMLGEAEPWPVGPGFREELAEAWEQLDEDDLTLRLAVAQLSAAYGAPAAFEKLDSFLALTDVEDPDGQIRFAAIMALAWLEDPRVAERLIALLRHPDPLWRLTAAGALQRFPGPATVEALAEMLDDPALELRGLAAISLSHLGDARGAAVLRELVEPASYEEARRIDPRKFTSERRVQETRLKGLEALARLALPEDRALFERLAAGEDDALVREAAMRALAR